MEDELLCRLALQFQPNIGNATIKKLLQYFGSAQAIFQNTKKDSVISRTIGRRVRLPVLSKESLQFAENELKWMTGRHISLVLYNDDDFPKRLRNCSDSPFFFYYKGKNIFNEAKMVAMVGTRNASPYGKEITKKIIEDLKTYNVCIVSGLAKGIDAVAHQQALENDLKTVAVMGAGLFTIYPDCNRQLARRIEADGCALISEYSFKAKPDRQHFPQRNRIIAGMSDATIVIETAPKGGSVITAYIAQSYNRDVFAVPGNVNSKTSEGCHELIRKNIAALVASGKDIAEMMGWDLQPAKVVQRSLFVELSAEEQSLVDIISQHPRIMIDEIIQSYSHYTASQIASILLRLELKGVIQCNPGKAYTIC
ncbi:MAG TPA: DNA-processing protein DprA [Bacteroidales bacterium]|nr:DNA-processing protein DprA [Bacteroidales bacterium]